MMKKKSELYLTFYDYVLDENFEMATLLLKNPFLKMGKLQNVQTTGA